MRATIFRDDHDYLFFRTNLLRLAETFSWDIHAYCLLPNHYHLLVEATRPALSAGMQRLNGRYAQHFNTRYARSGHVFESRFSSFVIETDHHLERALAYVRANPVEAGLCDRMTDWPWAFGPYDSD
jgi:REP element-mobilizing transposase RayT